ncbi:MAG TPA: NAD(+)/NADH kinase [Acidimicrobiales bacterium]|nr:NAD(+)/NADH kinase [Acidimicrobiales bacterium]
MATVAFVLHHEHREAASLARTAAAWLRERGHEVRLPKRDADLVGLAELATHDDELCIDLDVAVSLGGDGTMLRTVDLVSDHQVPVIGVNLGHLGYLTEVDAAKLTVALNRFFAGSYHLSERMRLAVAVEADSPEAPGSGTWPALNEAVLGKTPTGQIVHVEVIVDGQPFTTYHADGLIIATPTGSTAYAWSAGGPLISPDHAALLLAPVAPHMLFDRALVLPPASTVRLVVAEDRPAALSVDGRNLGTMQTGDAIVCTAAEHPARLVTFDSTSFLDIVKAKFGLGAR